MAGHSAKVLALAKKLHRKPLCKTASDGSETLQPTVDSDDENKVEVPQKNALVVNADEDIYDLDDDLEVITVNSDLCNHPEITSCRWNLCTNLRELHIGNGCLQNVLTFELVNMEHLHKVEIGSSCFTKTKGKMELSGCMKLRNVKIGKESCVEWKEFVMRQCGVEKVEIGDYCFVACENMVFEGEDERWQ